jgi:hypothetical protein
MVKALSTTARKIEVHSARPPQSNPNISQFVQTAVVFWADSDGDSRFQFAGLLLGKKKKTTASVAPALRQ